MPGAVVLTTTLQMILNYAPPVSKGFRNTPLTASALLASIPPSAIFWSVEIEKGFGGGMRHDHIRQLARCASLSEENGGFSNLSGS